MLTLRAPCRNCALAPLHGFHGNLKQQLGSKNSVVISVKSGGTYLCIRCMNEELKCSRHGGAAQHEVRDDTASVSYLLSVCWCHLEGSLLSYINETHQKPLISHQQPDTHKRIPSSSHMSHHTCVFLITLDRWKPCNDTSVTHFTLNISVPKKYTPTPTYFLQFSGVFLFLKP